MSQINTTPIFSDDRLLEVVEQYYGLAGELSKLPSYADLNRQLITPEGMRFVVKVANTSQSPDALDFENLVMNELAKISDLTVQVPRLITTSSGNQQVVEVIDEKGRTCLLRLISFLKGDLWADVAPAETAYFESLGKSLAQVDKALANIDHPASYRYLEWDIRHANVIVRKYRHFIENKQGLDLINTTLANFESRVKPCCSLLPVQIIHNDANDYNLLVDPGTKTVSGLFDFGDMVSSYRIADLAIAAAYAIMHKAKIEEIIGSMVLAYHKVYPLITAEIDVLLDLISIRLAVSLCMSSYEHTQSPENDYLLLSQKGAWDALRVLSKVDDIAFNLKLNQLCDCSSNPDSLQPQAITAFRKQHLSENLTLTYSSPLKIVAGRAAYLYDNKGTRYLDMVNNVCHVGHCHPKVVSAGQKQLALLNTNTRYLHENIVHITQKLLSTMPPELSVCMFVNSGSEANELALRLARTHTNRQAMVVVEGAYHGNTNACVEISPYKFEGPGGMGRPDWVKQTIVPDPFRGQFRGRNEQTGRKYAQDVQRVINEFEQEAMPVCGFICESIQGVGGQIIHPPGYLKSAYEFVRQAGGVCIADEVQVGMGRVGTHWWAFQAQDAVPDIVTIGKPLGNGHPMAVVVTTKEIAESFNTGMEYFNTFGGNPVSCAIGAAVFDVVEQENLMSHACEVGNYLQRKLLELQNRFPVIGDVRGLGMFLGVEFIDEPKSLKPAVRQIDYVIERLKDCCILLTTEGPLHNVLKIKPPLVFSKADAGFFLANLENILAETGAQII